ncbi:MAG: hypothetical protein OJI67_21780 [Prosthecobacter sp.]|nr:hypothetical protein [Prosthecobacter sp.]
MIFWKGRGLLILLFAVGGFLAGSALNSTTFAVWGGALAVWLFAFTLGKSSQQTLLDPETHQPVILKRSHTLYFLPPIVWAIGFTCLALFVTFAPEEDTGPEASNTAQDLFNKADDLISNQDNGTANGNTPEALKLAQEFSAITKKMRGLIIEQGKDSKFSLSGGDFLTYVHLTPERCLILVHVPGLRKFTSEAKQVMAQTAWLTARKLTRQLNPKPSELALGIRGALIYDRAYIGHLISPEEEPSKGIDQEIKGYDAKKALARFFEATPETAETKPVTKTVDEAPKTPAAESEKSEAPSAPESEKTEPAAAETATPNPTASLPTELREWKDASGRPLRASLVRFVNPEHTVGEFKREDGQLFEVPMGRFSEEDQKFIGTLSVP